LAACEAPTVERCTARMRFLNFERIDFAIAGGGRSRERQQSQR
jgi:hypothetical protein